MDDAHRAIKNLEFRTSKNLVLFELAFVSLCSDAPKSILGIMDFRFEWDIYCKFIYMLGKILFNTDYKIFEDTLAIYDTNSEVVVHKT